MKKVFILSFSFGIMVGIYLFWNKYTVPTKVADNTANVQNYLRLGEDINSDTNEASNAFTTMALNAKDGELCLSVIKKTMAVADNTDDCICDVTKKFHNEILEKCT